MKLVTKISVAATVSLLLFSQIILWYLLFQSNQTMMENKVKLEGEKLEHSYRQMDELLKKAGRMEMQMNTPVFISCFREFFEIRTAPVSYTHLDVYKRQFWDCPEPCSTAF